MLNVLSIIRIVMVKIEKYNIYDNIIIANGESNEHETTATSVVVGGILFTIPKQSNDNPGVDEHNTDL